MRKFEKYLGTTLVENQILHRSPKSRVDRAIGFKENEENPERHAEIFSFLGSTPIASKNQTKLPVREGYHILMYLQSLYKHFSTIRV